MHLTSTETRSLPALIPWSGAEPNCSEFQVSNGQLLYAVQNPPGYVALGEWSCATAGRVVFLTSLLKLGWAGPDEAVYIDRKKRLDEQGEVDFFFIGGVGNAVNNQRHVHLNVIMPEKICLMPPVKKPNGTLVPSVIYAAQDEDGVACIFNGLKQGPLVRDLKHLEDFWVNIGKLWVMTRGEMTSLSEPVNRKLRIYGPDGHLEQEADLRCVACRRPVYAQNKLIFPVQRWSKGPWELITGSECLWEGFDISNLYARRNGVHCLVSERPCIWRVLSGQSVSTFGYLGELVGDVSVWSGELLFHLRGRDGHEFVVYGGSTSRPFPEIDHTSLRVFEREPVFAARTTQGTGSWNLVYDDEIIGQPCDRILEFEAAPKTLRTSVLRGNQIVTEAYQP